MPVPSSINDLSTTAGSNSPGGGESPTDGDNYIRTHGAFIATLRDKLNGTSDTGTVKNATFSGTMAGAASWAGVQTFAAGLKAGNSAVADASTLDWYEEGFFTASVAGADTAGSCSYGTRIGQFTRIGRLVFVFIDLSWSSHTGAGALKVTGLPYSSASDAYQMRAVASPTASSTDALSAKTVSAQAYVTISMVNQETGANGDLLVSSIPDGQMHIQGFYRAA